MKRITHYQGKENYILQNHSLCKEDYILQNHSLCQLTVYMKKIKYNNPQGQMIGKIIAFWVLITYDRRE